MKRSIFLLTVLLVLGGCGTPIKLGDWTDWFDKRPKPGDKIEDHKFTDAINPHTIKGDFGRVASWRITYELDARRRGHGGVTLNQEATKVWPPTAEEKPVCATLWLIGVWPDGTIAGYPMDYVRPGGGTWNQKHIDMEWKLPNGKYFKDAVKIYASVAGLSRDPRRNVDERTNIDEVL